jgi:hypothetical protein
MPVDRGHLRTMRLLPFGAAAPSAADAKDSCAVDHELATR